MEFFCRQAAAILLFFYKNKFFSGIKYLQNIFFSPCHRQNCFKSNLLPELFRSPKQTIANTHPIPHPIPTPPQFKLIGRSLGYKILFHVQIIMKFACEYIISSMSIWLSNRFFHMVRKSSGQTKFSSRFYPGWLLMASV